jgi:1,4-dihydroxy-2-naphthoate octaprenyltransferase
MLEDPSAAEELNQRQIWLLAARPKTLPAAAAPVFVGSSLAFYHHGFRPLPALVTLITALLLQVGANLANDVFDFIRGADNENRLGPVRVTQSGLLTPRQVLVGMWVVFGLSAVAGVYLTAVSGWLILLIGGCAILAAIAYTGGPFPLGYYGLGDLFVFLFFGLAAVCGTYYIQTKTLTAEALLAAIPMGFLSTAILIVNNLRDIETDRAVGKHTLAVRLGLQGTRWEYLGCVTAAYLLPLILTLSGAIPIWTMTAWLSIPLAVQVTRKVWRLQGKSLNKALAETGRLELVYGIMFSLGWLVSTLFAA